MGSYLTRPSILSVVDAINEEETEFERRGNRHRDRGYALHEVDELSESSFATMFRITGRDLNSWTLVRVILFILDVYLSTTLG